MKNKYYVPTIEELHVGIEIQHRSLLWEKDDWEDWSTFKIRNITNLVTLDRLIHKEFTSISNIKDYEFRVKYLDKEDIESLGFIYKNGDYKLEGTKYSLWPKFSSNFDYSIIIREQINDMYFDIAIFPAKNVSELRRILKEIKIID